MDYAATEDLDFRKKLLGCINTSIKYGTQGICNRVKDLLTEVVEDNTYSLGRLLENEDLDEKESEEAGHFGEIEQIFTEEAKGTEERKMKHVTPFFTVIRNGGSISQVECKELNRNILNRKKNVSLLDLEQKIRKRNVLLDKFGKSYRITNLT